VGKVTAGLDTAHYKGPIVKTIQVTSNDPQTHQVQLELKAEVLSLIDVAPSETPLVTTMFGAARPTEITVSTSDGRSFDILAVQADPSVHVTVRSAVASAAARRPAAAPGRPLARGSGRYLVTITPGKDVPVGRSVANLTLTTNLAKAPTVPIRAVLVVTGPVEVVPDQLWVQPGDGAPTLHVRLRQVSGTGLQVLAVESSDPDFTTAVAVTAEGREYDVTVRYTGKPDRGRVSARITVKTNQPGQGAIVIPLAGSI